MRSANQFNKRAPPRNGRARQRRRVEGEGQTQRREANALTSHRAPRNVRASLGGGGNGHVSREGRRGNKNIVRVGGDSSKLHEANPRKHRAAPHKAGRRTSRMRCAGTPSPATPKRNTQEWQDSRAVRDSRGQCSEKGPSLARSSRDAFPKGDLQGILNAWRAYLAKASSFWMHGGDMLPGRGPFPVRGRFWDA